MLSGVVSINRTAHALTHVGGLYIIQAAVDTLVVFLLVQVVPEHQPGRVDDSDGERRPRTQQERLQSLRGQRGAGHVRYHDPRLHASDLQPNFCECRCLGFCIQCFQSSLCLHCNAVACSTL